MNYPANFSSASCKYVTCTEFMECVMEHRILMRIYICVWESSVIHDGHWPKRNPDKAAELPKCVKMNIPGQSKLHFEFCDQDRSWPKPKSRHFVNRITHDPKRNPNIFVIRIIHDSKRNPDKAVELPKCVKMNIPGQSNSELHFEFCDGDLCVYNIRPGWSFLLLFQGQNFSSSAWL